MRHATRLRAAALGLSILFAAGAGCAIEADRDVLGPPDAPDLVDDGAGDSADLGLVSPDGTINPPVTVPPSIVAFADNPRGVAVSSHGLFWLDSAVNFDKASWLWTLTVGGEDARISGAAGYSVSLVAYFDSLYWIDAQFGRVLRVGATGGAAEVLVAGELGAYALAVDADGVYWSNIEKGTLSAFDFQTSRVVRLASDLNQPAGIVLAGNQLVWANLGDGTLTSMPKAGGPVTALAAGRTFGTDPVFDGAHIYFGDLEYSSIMRVSAQSGTVEVFASGQRDPLAIAVADDTVYWTTGQYGVVASKPKAGGPITTIASQQADPAYIAVSESRVVWANTGDGAVWIAGR